MCEVFLFPLPLTEAFIMSQHAQIGSVLHSWCTQIPLLSPVTKIWLENSFTDVHVPNPVIQHGALMQFHGYMESAQFAELKGWVWLWRCSSLLSRAGNHHALWGWTYITAADDRSPPLTLAEDISTPEVSTFLLNLLGGKNKEWTELNLFLYGAVHAAG